MPIAGGIVVFVVIWWLVFYMALSFGVRGQWEEGGATGGTDPGAPVKHNVARKMLITSGIAIVLWSAVWVIMEFDLIDMRPDVTWEDL